MSVPAGVTLTGQSSSVGFGSTFSIANPAGGCLQLIAINQASNHNPYSYVGTANDIGYVFLL